MTSSRLVLLLLVSLMLAACAGGPPKRVYPPQASVQELRVLDDGSWRLSLRIRNFSTVPMRFSRLQASFTVGGQDATRFDFNPGVTVGPGSAELVEQVFTPGAGARDAVVQALANRRSVAYVLAGRLASSDPGTDDAFDYPSRLDPVPGLDGVLR
jgi:hypothetical protein